MFNLQDSLKGLFSVQFVGKTEYETIRVVSVISDANGNPIILLGLQDRIYNWSNIIVMKRIEEK